MSCESVRIENLYESAAELAGEVSALGRVVADKLDELGAAAETMTPRDRFAAAALQGLLAGMDAASRVGFVQVPERQDVLAAAAYSIADAMMRQQMGSRPGNRD
jgi:hypothetical protein